MATMRASSGRDTATSISVKSDIVGNENGLAKVKKPDQAKHEAEQRQHRAANYGNQQ